MRNDVASEVRTLSPGEGLKAACDTLLETGVFGAVFVAGVFLDADAQCAPTATSGMGAISEDPEAIRVMIAELRMRANEIERKLEARGL